jgi:hypothetical protein
MNRSEPENIIKPTTKFSEDDRNETTGLHAINRSEYLFAPKPSDDDEFEDDDDGYYNEEEEENPFEKEPEEDDLSDDDFPLADPENDLFDDDDDVPYN